MLQIFLLKKKFLTESIFFFIQKHQFLRDTEVFWGFFFWVCFVAGKVKIEFYAPGMILIRTAQINPSSTYKYEAISFI